MRHIADLDSRRRGLSCNGLDLCLHVFAVKEVLQIAISSWVARFIVSRIFLNVSVAASFKRGWSPSALMALVLFFGRPGSGKTYSAMADYILPALKEGRRILHNIAGFKQGVAFGDAPIFPDVNIKPDNTIEFVHSPMMTIPPVFAAGIWSSLTNFI